MLKSTALHQAPQSIMTPFVVERASFPQEPSGKIKLSKILKRLSTALSPHPISLDMHDFLLKKVRHSCLQTQGFALVALVPFPEEGNEEKGACCPPSFRFFGFLFSASSAESASWVAGWEKLELCSERENDPTQESC